MLKQMEELLQQNDRGPGHAERDGDVAVRAPTAAAQSGVMRLVDDDWTKGTGADDNSFHAPGTASAGSSMIRRLRLISGLVMLAYVTMHLLNHAVGLISLETMENVLWYIFRIWTNRPAQLLLYSSFLVHYALALYALWQRRTLRLHASEMSQIVLGFAIPLLLVRHVVVDAHLGQLLPHRCRLLRLSAVGLFRPLARSWFRADAGLGRRLGSRDDRPAFLAEGAPLVRAPATGGPRRRGARPCPIAARRDRSGSAGYRSGGRPELDRTSG